MPAIDAANWITSDQAIADANSDGWGRSTMTRVPVAELDPDIDEDSEDFDDEESDDDSWLDDDWSDVELDEDDDDE